MADETTDNRIRTECINYYSDLIDYIRIKERSIRVEQDILKQLRRETFTYMEVNDITCIIGESSKADIRPMSVNHVVSTKVLLEDIGLERFLRVVEVSIEKCKAHLTQQEFVKHTRADLLGQFRIKKLAPEF